jgi:hypothetical protein
MKMEVYIFFNVSIKEGWLSADVTSTPKSP